MQIGAAVTARIGLGRAVAQSGDFLNLTEVEGEVAYCTENLGYIDPLTGPFKPACFVDRDGDGKFEIVKAAPGMIWFETKLPVPAPYARGESVRPTADSKKIELLYQGYAGKTVKLSYREYINDMARPAFFQDVAYEIDSFPAEISFKNAKIRVVSAGNSGINYIVLSSF
ncbi:MAG: putative lipoprotein [Gemmatimonadales bacterium]|nr:putative lipoprotein [Gemmatimonadales bacterium]